MDVLRTARDRVQQELEDVGLGVSTCNLRVHRSLGVARGGGGVATF